jgi:hypothetical protein
MGLIFVGDIHSQFDNLSRCVEHHGIDAQYVFLGDINDSRMPSTYKGNTNFVDVYLKIRFLVKYRNAVLIQSNHQHNLIRILEGIRLITSGGMEHTLDCLVQAGYIDCHVSLEGYVKTLTVHGKGLDLLRWLKGLPYFYKTDSVVAVHAQYIEEHCLNPYDLNKKAKQCSMYGTRDEKNSRYSWWRDYQDSTYVVAGHYHEVFLNEYCAVIDAGCGEEGGRLATFDFDTKELLYF